jgi:hypothetical protein
VVRAFLPQVTPGNDPKLVIDQGQECVQGRAIALAAGYQHLRYIAHALDRPPLANN